MALGVRPAGVGRFALAFPSNVVRIDCERCNTVASQTAGVAA
jgi:hypothetical protein